MIKGTCHRCGHEYSEDVRKKWGQGGVGDGYGPIPVCYQTVPDGRGSNEVCRGPIVASAAHLKTLRAAASEKAEEATTDA